MIDASEIPGLTARLEQAEKTRAQSRQLSLEFPGMTIDDAYAVQEGWIALKINNGRSVKGHKIGLTSRAMQVSSNINEPDYGALLDDMFYNDGQELPFERF